MFSESALNNKFFGLRLVTTSAICLLLCLLIILSYLYSTSNVVLSHLLWHAALSTTIVQTNHFLVGSFHTGFFFKCKHWVTCLDLHLVFVFHLYKRHLWIPNNYWARPTASHYALHGLFNLILTMTYGMGTFTVFSL